MLTIGVNRAVVLLAEPAAERRRGAPQPLRELGPHPDGGAWRCIKGRYGPYVSHDGVIASLPRDADIETFSLEQAIPLLEARREKSPKRRRNATRPAAAKAAKASKGKAAKPAAAVKPAAKAKRAAPSKRAAGAPKKKKASAARPAKKPPPRAGAQSD